MEDIAPNSPEVQAYLNLPEFLAFRKLRAISEPRRPQTAQTFNAPAGEFTKTESFRQIMMQQNFWIVVAEPEQGGEKVIVMIVSEASKTTADQADLLQRAVRRGADGPIAELIVLFPRQFFAKKPFLEALRESTVAALTNIYSQDAFRAVVPKSPQVPRHEILAPEEAERLLRQLHWTRAQIPRLMQSEPAAIWYGVRPKDIVRIHRSSETTVTAHALRLCVSQIQPL